jgi:hypothetical protein
VELVDEAALTRRKDMIKRVRVLLQNAQNMMIQLANRKRIERYF